MKKMCEFLQKQTKINMFKIGATILLFIMTFVFILPAFYPYECNDIFYTTKNVSDYFGEICFNEQYMFYPAGADSELPESFSCDFEEFSKTDKISAEIISENNVYTCRRIVDELYTVSDEAGLVGIMSLYVIDFYDESSMVSVSENEYIEILMTADDSLNVYDSNGINVGKITKFIVRASDGKDTFTYEQKTELCALLYGENQNAESVYSRTLDCELFIDTDEDSISFYKYENKTLLDTYAEPSAKHWLGTDANGMDVLARLMYGGRISLAVGFFASLAGVIIGALIGCLSGLKSGITDMFLMRGIDIFDSLPALPLLLITGDMMSKVLLPSNASIAVMIAIIAIFSWSQTARVIRMKIIELNSAQDSVALDVAGVSSFRKIMFIIFPKILPQLTSLAFMGVGSAIMTESTMSFFGFGVGFPYAGWGIMLNDSTTVNELGAHPFIWVSTACMICLTVVGFYLLGESFIKENDFENYYSIGERHLCEYIRSDDRSYDILEIENLSVSFSLNGQIVNAVKDFSLKLRRGGIVAIVGRSGCGKSVTADAVAGLLSANCCAAEGRIIFRYQKRNKCRIGYVLQEPMSCFDPLMKVGKQLEESLLVYLPGISKLDAYETVIKMIERVGFSDPEEIYNTYPEQLSGGMCQRIMIASVLLQSPEFIIADEPCSSLDTHSKLVILDLLKSAVQKDGASLMLITHDIHEAKYLTDNIVRIDSKDMISNSESIHNVTENDSGRRKELSLIVQGVSKTYKNSKRTIKALDNVSFSLSDGKILGIMGNEGSGKTTLAEIIAGIKHSDCGKVLYNKCDITNIEIVKRRALKGKIQIIFQHPYSSLSSGVCVGRQIREVVRACGYVKKCDEYRAVIELMKECGLEENIYYRHIDTLSGGQCKRVCIARAIASKPDILICDEPLAYLDAELHLQIMELLKMLNKKYKMAMIFISHDTDSLREMCDEIMVLHDGHMVEYGIAEHVFNSPESEYCRNMIAENNLLKNNVSQSEKE